MTANTFEGLDRVEEDRRDSAMTGFNNEGSPTSGDRLRRQNSTAVGRDDEMWTENTAAHSDGVKEAWRYPAMTAGAMKLW